MTDYGLTFAGFVRKPQAVIISELQARIRATFGNNVNLDARSVFGQLIGVWSEREAELWELLQAVYASQYPGGAEGLSVDNILALNNLSRLGATPSVTNPAVVPRGDGITLYGLLLYGTPGTIVPKGSIIRDTSSPPLSFTLDEDVTIQAGSSAQQALIYSDGPEAGGYTLTVYSYRTGDALTLPVHWATHDQEARVSFTGTPSSGSFYMMIEGHLYGPYTTMDAGTIQADVSVDYASVQVSHEDDQPTHPFLVRTYQNPEPRPTFNITQVDFAAAPSTGSYKLLIAGSLLTAALTTLTASDVQAAIRALGGAYRTVFVYKAPSAATFYINWAEVGDMPSCAISANGTGQVVTIHAANTTPVAFDTTRASLEGLIGNLLDHDDVRPFTDVRVTTPGGTFLVEFGAYAPAGGGPPSAKRAIPRMTVGLNTLSSSGGLVTPDVTQYSEGAPDRGVGAATCTVKGPNAVAAGRLTVIGSPITGWASVNNDLDVIPGRNTESDLEALARRDGLLNAQATGPLEALVANLRKVPGVTSATGLQNATDAALQRISLSDVPTTGSWQLGVPPYGDLTGTIPYTADNAAVQAAINAMPGLELVIVAGTAQYGFVVDFNGAMGGQAQPLLEIWNNVTDVGISVAFARPPKSFEAIVLGGAATSIAAAIHAKLPAGIQAYGSPVRRTTAALTEGDPVIEVTDGVGILAGHAVAGLGIPPGSTVTNVAGTLITISGPAMGNYAASQVVFGNLINVSDAYGNITPIGFTRPTPVLVYVTVELVTDVYRTPGNSASGRNPRAKFQPGEMASIQQEILAIGQLVPPGGTIVGRGTQGLIGAFNDQPGIVDYTLRFGLSPTPSGDDAIQLQPDQAPIFQLATILVSYT